MVKSIVELSQSSLGSNASHLTSITRGLKNAVLGPLEMGMEQLEQK